MFFYVVYVVFFTLYEIYETNKENCTKKLRHNFCMGYARLDQGNNVT